MLPVLLLLSFLVQIMTCDRPLDSLFFFYIKFLVPILREGESIKDKDYCFGVRRPKFIKDNRFGVRRPKFIKDKDSC